MSNLSLHSEVSLTTEVPSPVPTVTKRTESPASQHSLPRSPPSSSSLLAKIRRSLYTAVGGARRLARIAGRPFHRNCNTPVRVTSPRNGSDKSAVAPSEGKQGHVQTLSVANITDEDSISDESDESWERRECADCRLCLAARRREALELSGHVVEVRPPPRPEFDPSLEQEFSKVTSPTSEADSEDGYGEGSGFQISEVFSDETEGGEEGRNASAAVVALERAGHWEDALPPPYSTRPPMSWKKTADLFEERQLAAKRASFAEGAKIAEDKAVENDTVAPPEVEDAIPPLTPTHPFMTWKRPPGMRTQWTFRTYDRKATEDGTEAANREDAIEPQFIGFLEKSGPDVQVEVMGAEGDEMPTQPGTVKMAGGEDNESAAPWFVRRPNKSIMLTYVEVIEIV